MQASVYYLFQIHQEAHLFSYLLKIFTKILGNFLTMANLYRYYIELNQSHIKGITESLIVILCSMMERIENLTGFFIHSVIHSQILLEFCVPYTVPCTGKLNTMDILNV